MKGATGTVSDALAGATGHGGPSEPGDSEPGGLFAVFAWPGDRQRAGGTDAPQLSSGERLDPEAARCRCRRAVHRMELWAPECRRCGSHLQRSCLKASGALPAAPPPRNPSSSRAAHTSLGVQNTSGLRMLSAARGCAAYLRRETSAAVQESLQAVAQIRLWSFTCYNRPSVLILNCRSAPGTRL